MSASVVWRFADWEGPTPYTGETPQALFLNERHKVPDAGASQERNYEFFYIPGALEVSPDHSHKELAQQLALSDDYSGPMALGHVVVKDNKAHWYVHSNISLRKLVKELKNRTKTTGWKWEGVSSIDGQPFGDENEFGSHKSFVYAYDLEDDHLYIAKDAEQLATATGQTRFAHIEVQGKTAYAESPYPQALKEWAEDNGFKLALGLVEPLERHFTLYHGTTNKALELARQRGGLHAWHPMDVAAQVASHYGLDPQQLYSHPYFEFSRGAREGENKIYASTDPHIAELYANDKSEQLDDALSTAHRMTYPDFYEQPVGGVTGQATKDHREQFKTDYYSNNNLQSAVVRLNVPLSASPEAQRMLYAGYEPSGNFTLDAPVPLDWMTEMGQTNISKLAIQGPHDNLLKNVEDLEQEDLYSPENLDQPGHEYYYKDQDDATPDGHIKCHDCGTYFDNWNEFVLHKTKAHQHIVPYEENGKLPTPDPHAPLPVRFLEEGPDSVVWSKNLVSHYKDGERIAFVSLEDDMIVDYYGPQSKIAQAVANHFSQDFGKLLSAPIPFIFDIQKDQIVLGTPGQRVRDIPGKFKPGGIVEGRYEPGGKMILETTTSYPYSIRHLLELWKHNFGYFLIKSVHMETDGKKRKIASSWEMDDARNKQAGLDDASSLIHSHIAKDPATAKAAQALQAAGGQVHVVGGAVRDAVMGKEPKDIDLMVSGLDPDTVHGILSSLGGSVNLTGKDFGVYRYREGHSEVEVALPRRERSIGQGYKDFAVQADPDMTPEEDLSRRDFTANAMALNLNDGQLLDPHGGISDIQNGVLRAVRPEALAEDPLRVLRAITAASKHNLYPEPYTRSAMAQNAPSMQRLPSERLQMELDKIMAGQNPAAALKLAHETGVLPYVLPEVSAAMGYNQNNLHHEQDLGSHLLSVTDRAKQIKPNDPDFSLAALLHDVGKPASHWTECQDCGSYYNGNQTSCVNCGSPNTAGHFYQKEPGIGQSHETVGAQMAAERLRALKYPNDRIDRVTHLIQNHMWPTFTSEKGARRFINTVGDQHADDLLAFRAADQGGKVDPISQSSLDQQQALVDSVRQQGQLQPLAINGNDLISLGVPQGPQMGQILNALRQQVVDDPSLNNPETLLGLAQQLR